MYPPSPGPSYETPGGGVNRINVTYDNPGTFGRMGCDTPHTLLRSTYALLSARTYAS